MDQRTPGQVQPVGLDGIVHGADGQLACIGEGRGRDVDLGAEREEHGKELLHARVLVQEVLDRRLGGGRVGRAVRAEPLQTWKKKEVLSHAWHCIHRCAEQRPYV